MVAGKGAPPPGGVAAPSPRSAAGTARQLEVICPRYPKTPLLGPVLASSRRSALPGAGI